MEISYTNINRLPRLAVGAILFLLVGVLGSCDIGTISFNTPDVPPAPCPIEELFLDESMLPNDEWMVLGSPSTRSAPARIGIERIGTGFSTRTYEKADHEIYRLSDENSAKKAYKDLSSWFDARDDETEWLTPLEMANISISPDRYRLGCSTRMPSGIERCQYISQYGPYVVRLWVVRRVISYDDVVVLIKEVDHRMTSCLAENSDIK